MSDPDTRKQENPLAVVLVSGGLDSCVCLAEARRSFETALLHVEYGQRAAVQERRAWQAIAEHYGCTQRLVAKLNFLKDIGGSSLVDPELPIPEGMPQGGSVPPTYVPFRNAHILSMGVSWAEVLGAEALFIGAVEEDSSGYPDCTEEFYRRFGEAVAAGTRPETRLTIHTPLIHSTKAEIVRRGVELSAPLHLTWSCYRNGDVACGVCESCQLRRRGFTKAGIEDPADYA